MARFSGIEFKYADILVDAWVRVHKDPEWVKRARWLKQDGYSIRAIAKKLNRTRYMVAKMLAQEAI